MRTRIQLLCVWAGPLFVVLFAISFWGIAGFIPPPAPTWSADKVSAFYEANRTEIRIGQLLGLISITLLFPWFAVITAQIARIEGRQPVLALMQFGAAVLLLVFFMLCCMLWIAASFRPELEPSTVRALHDLSWLVFVMVFPGYTLQMTCIALAAFMDDSPRPIWPRWAGYFNLWVGLSGMGGGLAVFFKEGPFAWNGLIGFYVPIACFAIWIGVMTYLMHTGIKRQAAEEAASEAPGAGSVPALSAA